VFVCLAVCCLVVCLFAYLFACVCDGSCVCLSLIVDMCLLACLFAWLVRLCDCFLRVNARVFLLAFVCGCLFVCDVVCLFV
jgi:hypothetical protein